MMSENRKAGLSYIRERIIRVQHDRPLGALSERDDAQDVVIQVGVVGQHVDGDGRADGRCRRIVRGNRRLVGRRQVQCGDLDRPTVDQLDDGIAVLCQGRIPFQIFLDAGRLSSFQTKFQVDVH